MAKAAVDTGLWYLAEYTRDEGTFTLNRRPKEFASIADYTRAQSRFRSLGDADLEHLAAARDAKWARIDEQWQTKR
jgi:pyruvate ferredoxin oxidoreductase beta subunit